MKKKEVTLACDDIQVREAQREDRTHCRVVNDTRLVSARLSVRVLG